MLSTVSARRSSHRARNGQEYSARQPPNTRVWNYGRLLIIALIASMKHLFTCLPVYLFTCLPVYFTHDRLPDHLQSRWIIRHSRIRLPPRPLRYPVSPISTPPPAPPRADRLRSVQYQSDK